MKNIEIFRTGKGRTNRNSNSSEVRAALLGNRAGLLELAWAPLNRAGNGGVGTPDGRGAQNCRKEDLWRFLENLAKGLYN